MRSTLVSVATINAGEEVMRANEDAVLSDEVGVAAIETVATAIMALPPGVIMTAGEAAEISWRAAERVVGELLPGEPLLAHRFRVRRQLSPSFHLVRELVAAQLVGMTYDDIVSSVEEAVARLCEAPELVLVPKPTMQFSGYCERHDGWNLFCNANRVEAEVEKRAERLEGDAMAVFLRLMKAQELLGFVCTGEVSRADIEKKAFDGKLGPMGAPFHQAAAS